MGNAYFREASMYLVVWYELKRVYVGKYWAM